MYKKLIKRLLDLTIGLLGLPFLIIALVILAPIIYFSDKGPIFYNAERIGKNGKMFIMYKFRSMCVNAPDIRLADGSTYNGKDDPRVTKIGMFIRKTSIDEIPQILNIFKGDMALIGPRPDPPDWLKKYPDDIREFLKVRPGITGYSQAYFRNEANGYQKMKNDLYYAQHCSFVLDVKIFFKTIAVVLKQANTYKNTENDEDALAEAKVFSEQKKVQTIVK